MKRFNFKLEKLLNLREFYERQAEIELAQAISKKENISNRLQIIANLKVEANKKMNLSVKVDDLHSNQNYIIRLNAETDFLLKEIILAEENVKSKQKKYVEAMVNRKAISKLKDKKMTNWKKNNIKAEDDFVDDIVSFKYGKEIRERR